MSRSKAAPVAGEVFGGLTIVGPDLARPDNWLCRCRCGAAVSRSLRTLRRSQRKGSVSMCSECVRPLQGRDQTEQARRCHRHDQPAIARVRVERPERKGESIGSVLVCHRCLDALCQAIAWDLPPGP